MSILDELEDVTKVVADTGEIELIKQYMPIDATTNPTLLYSASLNENYNYLIKKAFKYSKLPKANNRYLDSVVESLYFLFGMEILSVIKGRVSIEIDPRISFDQKRLTFSAKNMISMFDNEGIKRSRILIKIPATWEGIKAAKELEKENIHCNLTLVFSFVQAAACADAGVTLISPFVGRILDWYMSKNLIDEEKTYIDPGVLIVQKIFNYCKYHKFNTEIMAASFRNTDQIKNLAGCDLITISPDLLNKLKNENGKLKKKLSTDNLDSFNFKKVFLQEHEFRKILNYNQMAYEKLGEGIRKFSFDYNRLKSYLLRLKQ